MASKRLQQQLAAADDEQSVDLSPMIDMVFLLLIFFIVNSNLVIVKLDANVEVPLAADASNQSSPNGRIVINVYKDGSYKNENLDTTFETDRDIEDYVKNRKEVIDTQGYEPVLHLRGDRNAVFKYSRRVIRSSAAAGVDNVKFATYANNPDY